MFRRVFRRRRSIAWLALALLLLLPERPPAAAGAGREPFVWDRDELWTSLEARFAEAREDGCDALNEEIVSTLDAMNARVAALEMAARPPGHPDFVALEEELFDVGPLVAACPSHVPAMLDAYARMRDVVKAQSARWSARDRRARAQVYRLLYGGRMAAEEVLLQQPVAERPGLVRGIDEPSRTPAAELLGIEVHSGDILLSRGGAPTSALIARGNDFPGNFSHVALLHVSDDGEVSLIEAHIERGVAIASSDTYLRDRKLRVMVLRPRADLPAMREDPMLPHHAAERALREARERHIPYDFAMDYGDPSSMFCSEVASSAYRDEGVELWEGLTSMSSRGVTAWLAGFGVTHFETHGPSDLEYDPKLAVVAEWRDPELLFEDHLDVAVIDAMLEGAERGDRIDYDTWDLPLARLAKAYSVLLNTFGDVGPVPEGMTAAVALRARALSERHDTIAARTRDAAERFERERGYVPPYWELVRLARDAVAQVD